MDDCCNCAIDVQAMQAEQRRVLRIVLMINALTFLMMVGAAVYSRSSSLLSGGLDSFGDALTYALSLAVVGASARAKARARREAFRGLTKKSIAPKGRSYGDKRYPVAWRGIVCFRDGAHQRARRWK